MGHVSPTGLLGLHGRSQGPREGRVGEGAGFPSSGLSLPVMFRAPRVCQECHIQDLLYISFLPTALLGRGYALQTKSLRLEQHQDRMPRFLNVVCGRARSEPGSMGL